MSDAMADVFPAAIIVSEAERQPHPTVPPLARSSPGHVETTSSAPFRAASTMKAETGPHQLHFRQPPKSVVVVRRGGDVQLDCRLSAKPHAIVSAAQSDNGLGGDLHRAEKARLHHTAGAMLYVLSLSLSSGMQ